MISVIHKKNTSRYKNVVYVGRGSSLGNPYTSIKGRDTLAKFVVESRKESIECFKNYLLKCIEEKEEKVCEELNKIYSLALKEDVYISCYCKPKSCHGDVIKEIIELKLQKPKTGGEQVKIEFNKGLHP